jgi:sodium transport system permease protein
MSGWMTVALKEIRDHRRDRRSLISAALYSLMGPVVILLVAQSPAAARGGAPLLLSMMSVFALVSAFTGGMYLALDATAGERDRGSLVPLLLNPIPSLQLVAGKWIAVGVFAVAGLALNLAAFTAVFEWSGIAAPEASTGPLLLWMVCGLLPLTLLGAALHMLTGAASRTLKDAQARLSIVAMVPMMTGMFLVFFPDTIGRWWFAIPVVGSQALITEALRGHTVSLLQAGTLAFLTLAMTAALLLAAGRIMSGDESAAQT